MSDAGLVGFANAGNAKYLSPAIWANSPCSRLNDEGKGFYGKVDFLATLDATITTSLPRPYFNDALTLDCDDDTVLAAKAGERGGYQDFETDGDDNDAYALYSQPFCRLVKNSTQPFWAEARLEVGAIADQGLFFGLAEEAALSRDVVADGAATVIGESLIGFLLSSDDTDAIDAIYRKDSDAVVEVLADVTNATAIPEGDRGAVAADTEYKLGLLFDGRETLRFFVNGYNVANVIVDSTLDQSKDMGLIIGHKTGTAAAQSAAIDWVAYGFQELS